MGKEAFIQKLKEAFSIERIRAFIDKFGFYLILLICLAIIGATAFLTQKGSPGDRTDDPLYGEEQSPSDIPVEGEGPDKDEPDKIDIIITDVTGEEDQAPLPVKTDDEEALEETDISEGKPDDSAAETNTDTDSVPVSSEDNSGQSVVMEMPVEGEIMRPYAMDVLVFSPTLKEWTTHAGVDLAGAPGDEVRAALDGLVESIEEDPLRGIVITLAHENDLKTVYMGLSTGDMVQPGQSVKKGQVISGIGRTAAFEIIDDPHLHFEVLLNGENQDPMDYLDHK